MLPFLLVAFLMVSLQGTTQTQASENEQTLWKLDDSIVVYVTSTEMDFESRCTESTSEIAFRRFLAKARFVFASQAIRSRSSSTPRICSTRCTRR